MRSDSKLISREPASSWVNYRGRYELVVLAETQSCIGAVKACVLCPAEGTGTLSETKRTARDIRCYRMF